MKYRYFLCERKWYNSVRIWQLAYGNKWGTNMGQINLYKIDENKKDDFLNKLTEKFEFIGEQDYNSMENEKLFIL